MKDPLFRRRALIALAAILGQFFLFKQFYPFASFFQDSYTYIDVAVQGGGISYRPIGYSWFLMLIHFITSSDSFLVFIQYCLLQLAALYLYNTIECLYCPGKVVRNILFVFLLFDPLSLYLANLVSSDALFTALTLVWLTGLLWLMHHPSWRRLMGQAALLVVLFFIRYNALCYPIIVVAAILVMRKDILFKIAGIALNVVPLVLGTMLIGQLTKEQTGVRVFSAFSGWQLANNALYIYPYIKVDQERWPSPEFRELDSMVKVHFDTAGFSRPGPQVVETWYMWDRASPLKQYMFLRQRREHTGYFTAWNRVGPLFAQYGFYLMIHHPLVFIREYGWPSTRMFFYPPLDVLGEYNLGDREVDPLAKEWFKWKTTRVKAWSFTAQGAILGATPGIYLIINLAFVVAVLLLFLKYKRGAFQTAILLTTVYFVVNAAFSIFSTPNLMRYQVGPFIWIFVFTVLAFHRLFSPWIPGPAARRG